MHVEVGAELNSIEPAVNADRMRLSTSLCPHLQQPARGAVGAVRGHEQVVLRLHAPALALQDSPPPRVVNLLQAVPEVEGDTRLRGRHVHQVRCQTHAVNLPRTTRALMSVRGSSTASKHTLCLSLLHML